MASLDSTPIASLLMLAHAQPHYALKRPLSGFTLIEEDHQGQPLFLESYQVPSDQLGDLTDGHHVIGHDPNSQSLKHTNKRRRPSQELLTDIEHRRPPSPLDALVMALEVSEEMEEVVLPPPRDSTLGMVGNAEVNADAALAMGYNMGRRGSSASSNGEKKMYNCDFEACDKQFMQLAHLRIHQRCHTGQRPYGCQFPGCDKAFTQLGNLKTHERKHTGERPYRCPQHGCGKTFTQLGNLKTHERIHLSVKPYLCSVDACGKRFSQLGNLKTHGQKMHPNHTYAVDPHTHQQSSVLLATTSNPQSVSVPHDELASAASRSFQRTSSAREFQLLSKIKGIVAKQSGGRKRDERIPRVRRFSETDGSDIGGSEGDIIE